MDGTRMEMAKNSLMLFLKSLPPNCYFNVVSYGTDCAFLFENSRKLSEEDLEFAF